MRIYLVAAIVLFTGTQSAIAEDCKEKFIRLMSDRTAKAPTKIHIVQEIKGGAKTVNWNYQDGKGNWLTEMVEPANSSWSMGLDNVLYTSSDKGKTWTKVRDMGDQNAEHQKSLDERAATVENAVCGTAEIEGVMHETVEADYKMQGAFNADIHDKFWVNAETGYTPRLETTMKSSAFESFIVQKLEPAPDFVMPKPK